MSLSVLGTDVCSRSCPAINLASLYMYFYCGAERRSHLGCLGLWFPDWSHVTRKRRLHGLSTVLGDPCLIRRTCNLIYPISGARIEAWVAIIPDKRRDSSIKDGALIIELSLGNSLGQHMIQAFNENKI